MFVEYSEYKSHPTKSFPVLHDIITVASIAAKQLVRFFCYYVLILARGTAVLLKMFLHIVKWICANVYEDCASLVISMKLDRIID